MNRRQFAYLLVGVVMLHLVGFWLISGTHPLPKVPFVAAPDFVAKEAIWTDKENGEKIIVREFKVSTKLAAPGRLMEKKP